jgi:hypothetical protein
MTFGREERIIAKHEDVSSFLHDKESQQTLSIVGEDEAQYNKVDAKGRRKLGAIPLRKKYLHLHSGMILSSPQRISQLEDAMSEIKKMNKSKMTKKAN